MRPLLWRPRHWHRAEHWPQRPARIVALRPSGCGCRRGGNKSQHGVTSRQYAFHARLDVRLLTQILLVRWAYIHVGRAINCVKRTAGRRGMQHHRHGHHHQHAATTRWKQEAGRILPASSSIVQQAASAQTSILSATAERAAPPTTTNSLWRRVRTPSPSADLSHALRLHAALRVNKHRAPEGDSALLFIVPAFSDRSCEGTSHLERMAAAATRASPWFAKAPSSMSSLREPPARTERLWVILVVCSKSGAIGLCTSRMYCSARFSRRAEIPCVAIILSNGSASSLKAFSRRSRHEHGVTGGACKIVGATKHVWRQD